MLDWEACLSFPFRIHIQSYALAGLGVLLTVAEAKKRKAEIGLQSRKQQKLLQAEQPRTSECLNI